MANIKIQALQTHLILQNDTHDASLIALATFDHHSPRVAKSSLRLDPTQPDARFVLNPTGMPTTPTTPTLANRLQPFFASFICRFKVVAVGAKAQDKAEQFTGEVSRLDAT